jgi:hypothetical protein
MDDDDLITRVRNANPGRTRRGSPLSARAEFDLEEILRGSAHSAVRLTRKLKISWAVAAVTVFALAFVIAVTDVGQRMPASVAAPPQLTFTPVNASLSDVLERLMLSARENTAGTPSETIRSESWAANITIDEQAATVAVQPREVERRRNSDLSGYVEVRAGSVRWGKASREDPVAETVLEHYEYAPGTYPLLFSAIPPSSADELHTYLRSFLLLTDESSTGDVFRGIQDLRNDWTLDGPQSAALLDMVKSLPDVELLGRVTDRLGREGIAVQTSTRADGTFRDILVFDGKTGSLIAAEAVYLGGAEDVPLPDDTVVNYIAWKEIE